MISFDTNVVFAAINADAVLHAKANAFIASLALAERNDVVVSELMLLELFVLLRNPAVLAKPLTAKAAAGICGVFRENPRWQSVGLPLTIAFFTIICGARSQVTTMRGDARLTCG